MDILSVETCFNEIQIKIFCTLLEENNLQVPINVATIEEGRFATLTDLTLSRILRMSVQK